jgi:hypothetical protein
LVSAIAGLLTMVAVLSQSAKAGYQDKKEHKL